MILTDIDRIVQMERIEFNEFINNLDRAEMERVIRAFVAYEKKNQQKKITLTEEQFEMHFRLSQKKGKRGRPSLFDDED